jgi:diguanylate cyclase (GGDEF)-like protein
MQQRALMQIETLKSQAVKHSKGKFWAYYAAIVIVSGLSLFGFMLTFHQLRVSERVSLLSEKAKLRVDVQHDIIFQYINRIVADLFFLTSQVELNHYLNAGNEMTLKEVEAEYLSFAYYFGLYDQIRFLDENGQEKVQVNFNDGQPGVEPNEKLEQISQRDYYRKSMELNSGEVYFSSVQSDSEGESLTDDPKPTMRIATPVSDQKGVKRGVIILNYLTQSMLNAVKEAGEPEHGYSLLVNADGYFLCGIKDEHEFGFMRKDRADVTMAKLFPAVWEQLQDTADARGQIASPLGLFTYARLNPFERGKIKKQAGPLFSDPDKDIPTIDRQHWTMVSFIPADQVAALTESMRKHLSIAWALMMLVILVVARYGVDLYLTRREFQRTLFQFAHYDNLTKLPNRMLFFDRLQQAVQQAKRYQHWFGLLFIDLDGFKAVNDHYGHHAGDLALQEVAKRLKELLRESDTVARLGGDEFAAILSRVNDEKDAGEVAGRVVEMLSKPYKLDGHDCKMGASVGVSVFPADSDDAQKLLSLADTAMYEAKHAGKSTYRYASRLGPDARKPDSET